jgi:hypothetical protein
MAQAADAALPGVETESERRAHVARPPASAAVRALQDAGRTLKDVADLMPGGASISSVSHWFAGKRSYPRELPVVLGQLLDAELAAQVMSLIPQPRAHLARQPASAAIRALQDAGARTEDLAELIPAQPWTVTRWLRGAARPPPPLAAALQQLVGVESAARIIGLIPSPQPRARAPRSPALEAPHAPGANPESVGSAIGADHTTVSLHAAARRVGVRTTLLLARVQSGEVRAKRIDRGSRVEYRLQPHELDEDLARFQCRHPGCHNVALGNSGGCREHCGKLALTGKPKPAETRAKMTATLRLRYPILGERVCELEGCENTFVVSEARAARGDGHYCSLAHVGEGHSAAFEQLYADLATEGRLAVSQAAERLLVHPQSVKGYIWKGQLPADRRIFRGRTYFTVDPKDVERCKRIARERERLGRVGDGHPARADWLDPDYVIKQYRAHGWLALFAAKHRISEDQAERLLRDRVKARRKLLLPGRPTRSAPPARHLQWLDSFNELRDYYERRAYAGEQGSSAWRLYLEVAVGDFAAHPERWTYAPEDAPRAAADRVMKAVKPLLTAQRETPPA